MVTSILNSLNLAIALPSLRISPLFLMQIMTITTLYFAAFLIYVVYIQSIGSGIGAIDFILLSSVLPLKVRRLSLWGTQKEKLEFTLTNEQTNIIKGLLLGDVYAERRSLNGNTRIRFDQGTVHESYILHLYDLFKDFCASPPIITSILITTTS